MFALRQALKVEIAFVRDLFEEWKGWKEQIGNFGLSITRVSDVKRLLDELPKVPYDKLVQRFKVNLNRLEYDDPNDEEKVGIQLKIDELKAQLDTFKKTRKEALEYIDLISFAPELKYKMSTFMSKHGVRVMLTND
eukprot:m.30863 g.30863  ORF g.30863 m.30863 type:complete len:136 (+) comp6259_c0_seq2:117-524(+)